MKPQTDDDSTPFGGPPEPPHVSAGDLRQKAAQSPPGMFRTADLWLLTDRRRNLWLAFAAQGAEVYGRLSMIERPCPAGEHAAAVWAAMYADELLAQYAARFPGDLPPAPVGAPAPRAEGGGR